MRGLLPCLAWLGPLLGWGCGAQSHEIEVASGFTSGATSGEGPTAGPAPLETTGSATAGASGDGDSLPGSAGPATSATTGSDEGGDLDSSTGSSPAGTGGSGRVSYDALNELSDEFEDAQSVDAWTLRHEVEGTESQYTVLDIDGTTPGQLTMIPLTSGWFDDFDAPFLFKLVPGDFMVETQVVAGRQDDPALPPNEFFNSAGLLVRAPDEGPGTEDWVIHNVGRQAGIVGTEGKTTVNSTSVLELVAGPHRGVLRVCRIGDDVILTRRLEGESTFAQTHTFARDDLPETLQVGVAVNGWNAGGNLPDYTHTPDIRATFEYVRFSSIFSEEDCLADEGY
jgi:hypothetical protein